MRIVFSIIAVVICMAVIFFTFNIFNLETVKLENEIGSYSAVRVDMYDKYDKGNVNTATVEVNPNYIGDNDMAFYFNEATLKIPNSSAAYPNLTKVVNDITNAYLNFQTFNVLDNNNDLIIKVAFSNFELPKEPPSNIPMTPQRFFEVYPNGVDMTIKTAKMSKIILGSLPAEEDYITLTDLKVRTYCAPNPNGNGKYLINVVPYEYLYEYNLFGTFEVINSDLNAIKAAKPNFANFGINQETGAQTALQYLVDLFVYPIKLWKFYGTSAEILISDLSGVIFVNELEAYSPF